MTKNYYAIIVYAGQSIIKMELNKEQKEYQLDAILNLVYLYLDNISESFPVKLFIDTMTVVHNGEDDDIDIIVDEYTFNSHREVKNFQDNLFKDFFR